MKLSEEWMLISLQVNTVYYVSTVIRQKGETQNGCSKKTKDAKFSENEHFLPPDTHM